MIDRARFTHRWTKVNATQSADAAVTIKTSDADVHGSLVRWKGADGVPTSAVDVAEEIVNVLSRGGSVNSVVLEKVLYYCQGWSRIWRPGMSLFRQPIQAWANGPVVPAVYARHRLVGRVNPGDIAPNPNPLSVDERAIIHSVAPFYARLGAEGLITLTHGERPWRLARARANASPGERSEEEIRLTDMDSFFESLVTSGSRHVPTRPNLVGML